jgi:hypothetical protein
MYVAYRPVMSQMMHLWRKRSMLHLQQFRTESPKSPLLDDSAHTRCPLHARGRRKIWHSIDETDSGMSFFDYPGRNPIVSPHSSDTRGGRFE